MNPPPFFYLSLIIYLFPFLPVTFIRLQRGHLEGFSPIFFLAASTVEFIISCLILLRFSDLDKERVTRYEYWLRTVLGLPLTIYCAETFMYGSVALLRFFPFILYLSFERKLSFIIWHTIFFTIGLLLFSMFLRSATPSPASVVLVMNSLALVLLTVIWERVR